MLPVVVVPVVGDVPVVPPLEQIVPFEASAK